MFEVGKDQTVEVAGERWTLGRLQRRVVLGFRDWIAKQVGDPFALADRYLGKIPEAEWAKLFREACDVRDQLQAFGFGCPLCQKWFSTELGQIQVVLLMLQVNHPQATEADAEAVWLKLFAEGAVEAAVQKAQGGELGGPAKNAEAPA